MSFKGFSSDQSRPISLPASFFSELLPEINHMGELKLTLYVLWRFQQMEGPARYLRPREILADRKFMRGMTNRYEQPEEVLEEALERAVSRGTLLSAEIQTGERIEPLYFLNSPKGRAALQGLNEGKWQPEDSPHTPTELRHERPNVFRLYEANIGPLTPMLAESLRDAEQNYPIEWIEDAIQIAVENNVRRWRYVEAILQSWQEKGRDDRKDKRDSEKDRRKYVEGEFSDFIEH